MQFNESFLKTKIKYDILNKIKQGTKNKNGNVIVSVLLSSGFHP